VGIATIATSIGAPPTRRTTSTWSSPTCAAHPRADLTSVGAVKRRRFRARRGHTKPPHKVGHGTSGRVLASGMRASVTGDLPAQQDLQDAHWPPRLRCSPDMPDQLSQRRPHHRLRPRHCGVQPAQQRVEAFRDDRSRNARSSCADRWPRPDPPAGVHVIQPPPRRRSCASRPPAHQALVLSTGTGRPRRPPAVTPAPGFPRSTMPARINRAVTLSSVA